MPEFASTMRLGLLIACALLAGCQQKSELVVFHASSLSRVFGDVAQRLKAANPKLVVRLEPSGSQVAARKVAEQGLKADIVAAADDDILRRLLVPGHASRVVVFATNELVLAHLAHSRGTDEVSADNWPEVLGRDGVQLGRVDEDLAPLGYHTLLGWQLAERTMGVPGLARRLSEGCARQHVTHDEAELLALLEARAIDYAFLYRSTAEDHRLKVTPLPVAANLSRLELTPEYARAAVEVRARSSQPKVRVTGRAITFGLVVTTDATNPKAAQAFLDALTSPDGRRALERHGFRPLPGRDAAK